MCLKARSILHLKMEFKLKNIPIIDAHVHLWDLQLLQYPWLDEEPGIKKNFMLKDYQLQTCDFQIDKMVFIQADCLPEQNLKEVEFVMAQALTDKRLQGIVAYAPLEKGLIISELLGRLQTQPLVKGVRKMYDRDPSICTNSLFLDAVSMLPEYNFSFDLSIKPVSVKHTLKMIKECSDTRFVLAHLAKPNIKMGDLDQFKRDMDAFAALPNVVAKLSGLITEAARQNWTNEQISPYIDYAIECFGFDRLMYGGDWPVVLLAGTYRRWLETVYESVQDHHEEDVHKLFYGTAKEVYGL